MWDALRVQSRGVFFIFSFLYMALGRATDEASI